MLRINSKNQTRQRVHDRIRKKVMGTPASTADDRKGERVTGGNVASAKVVGKKIAELAKAKGFTKVVFDRGGYIYHGRVKAVADAAREAGLQF